MPPKIQRTQLVEPVDERRFHRAHTIFRFCLMFLLSISSIYDRDMNKI